MGNLSQRGVSSGSHVRPQTTAGCKRCLFFQECLGEDTNVLLDSPKEELIAVGVEGEIETSLNITAGKEGGRTVWNIQEVQKSYTEDVSMEDRVGGFFVNEKLFVMPRVLFWLWVVLYQFMYVILLCDTVNTWCICLFSPPRD